MKNKFISILNHNSSEVLLIEELYNKLQDIYSVENRFYHCLEHINSIITDLDTKWEMYTLEELLGNSFSGIYSDKESVYRTLYLATWFHDAVFTPGSNSNEIDSADLAAWELQRIKHPEKQIKTICELILCTISHRPIFDNGIFKIFLDLDLAILGKEKEVYDNYCKNIRKEYSFVQQKDYSEKRIKILSNFLKRDKLFYTTEFQNQYEMQARKNMTSEIQALSIV
jgi:predicted metal-dependent HD superfamily phosphohydrolase